MDSAKRASSIIPRAILGGNNFIVLASSAITTGILSHFIHHYRARGTHLVYQEVIAVVTLFIYLFAMFLPALKSYRGYLLPLNLALSYLWLTSLIFSSQDYSGHRCYYNSPPLVNRCGLKHTVQAFNIIGFVALLGNSITEGLMWARHRGSQPLGGDVEKDRPLTSAAERAGLPIGANGDGQRHAAV